MSDDGSPIFFLFSPNFQLKKFSNFSINYGYKLWYQIIATCEGKKEKEKVFNKREMILFTIILQ